MPNKAQSELNDQITRSMRAKETSELLQIWVENDRSQWTDAAFAAVQAILLERQVEIPAQQPPSAGKLKTTSPARLQKGFIWGWLLVNLIGWGIAVFYAGSSQFWQIMEQLGDVSTPEHIPDAIIEILGMVGIALGIGLGMLQSFHLARWNIPALKWILATVIGWGIAALGLPLLRRYLLFNDYFIVYLQALWIIAPLLCLLTGAFIGSLQALVLGKRMAQPWYWALANALGLLLFGVAFNMLLGIPIGFNNSPIDVILDPQQRPFLAGMHPLQLWLLIGCITPFLAALLTGLPTGMVFERFFATPDDDSVEEASMSQND